MNYFAMALELECLYQQYVAKRTSEGFVPLSRFDWLD